MSLRRKKAIRDATIAPGTVLSSEIGYANNFEKVIGTYPVSMKNVRSKVFDITQRTGSSYSITGAWFKVDYTTGTIDLDEIPDNYKNYVSELSEKKQLVGMKRIVGYKLDHYPYVPVGFFVRREDIPSLGMASECAFQDKATGRSIAFRYENILADSGYEQIEVFYEPE